MASDSFAPCKGLENQDHTPTSFLLLPMPRDSQPFLEEPVPVWRFLLSTPCLSRLVWEEISKSPERMKRRREVWLGLGVTGIG